LQDPPLDAARSRPGRDAVARPALLPRARRLSGNARRPVPIRRTGLPPWTGRRPASPPPRPSPSTGKGGGGAAGTTPIAPTAGVRRPLPHGERAVRAF